MKISRIKSFPMTTDRRSFFFVKVETDEGLWGVGEAGITRWGRSIEQAVAHLAERLVGQDPFSTEALWQLMFRGSFFPADKVVCSAISAIDIALWDIKGKAVGLPLYKLLGGRCGTGSSAIPTTRAAPIANSSTTAVGQPLRGGSSSVGAWTTPRRGF